MALLVKTWPAKVGERCNNLKKGKMSFSPQCSPRSSVSFTVWWERSRVRLVIVHFQTRLSAVCSCLEMELPFIQFIYKLPIWKLSSGHRTRVCQFSFQSLRKAMPKNTQTTTQLHSSHMLAKSCSKFSKTGFNNVNCELPDV